MPTSNPSIISFVSNQIIKFKPQSFLDLGCGFGKYGVLAREYGDIWRAERYYPEQWKVRIDAVEIFDKYITQLHKYVYNNIYIENIYDFIKNYNKEPYDMVICIGVIEHFYEDIGKEILSELKHKMKYCIVTTPVNCRKQGAVLDNIYEKHLSSWTKELLELYGDVFIKEGVYYLEINKDISWM